MRATRALSAAVALPLAAGAVAVVRSGDEAKTAVIYLPRAVHLYAGSDVSVLGVRIGEVTAVEPEGDRVRVELSYDADQRVPADAQAALVSPTLVADRYVQLTPVYEDGPVLPDGGTIPLARGQVPVELDDIVRTLRDLSSALGPQGANRDGALSDLVRVAADNLEGNGARAGDALGAVAGATGTLADNRAELFGTIRNLQLFTTELASRDATVRAFAQDLAKVSGQLADERQELGTALQRLALALGKVTTFLRDNREDLTANVANLRTVAAAVAAEKENLGKVLEIAPTGISNFTHLYNPESTALNGRINANDKYEDPAYFICSLYTSVGLPADSCAALLGPLGALPIPPGAPR